MEKVLCYCVYCVQFGGQTVTASTRFKHVQGMIKNGHTPEKFPWLQQFYRKEETQNRDPITPLGQLVNDPSDPRRNPLHVNCDITQINFMAIILKLRNKYGISEKDIDQLLLLFRKISCPEHIIPDNMTKINELTRDLIVHHKEHAICNCEEYRFVAGEQCPYCKKTKQDGTRYLSIPIGPRLQQLKEIPNLARLTTVLRGSSRRFVNDLHLSQEWNKFQENMGDQSIALSYCSDGFNPFHHIVTAGSYSIWAQSGLILNLPPQLRTKIGTILLYGLIPGPRPPKKINVYNDVLVTELVELQQQGLQVFNAASKTRENIKVGLLYLVGDVPGIAKEQNRVQQNAKSSCGYCYIEGQHCPILDKVIYPGGRLFLKPDDNLRADRRFASGETEAKVVSLRCQEHELAISRYQDCLEKETKQSGKKNSTLVSAITQQTGRLGSNQWIRLGLDLQQKHAPVDPMHAIKVFAEHMTKILNGEEDGPKVRAAERASGRFTSACPDTVYTVYVKEKKTIGQMRSQALSDGEQNLQKKFPKNSLPPAPFTLLPDDKFLTVLEKVFHTTVDLDTLDTLEAEWHKSLVLLERDFPASIQTYVFHLLHHLVDYIRLYGPPSNFWMFPYERFNHTLSSAVTNNQYPEISAIKKIEVQWFLEMLDSAGLLANPQESCVMVKHKTFNGYTFHLVSTNPLQGR